MRKQIVSAALVALVAAAACAHGKSPPSSQQAAQQPVQQPIAQGPAAQPPPTTLGQAGAGAPPGRTLQDNCVDLMSGRVIQGEDVATLRARCEELVRRGGAPPTQPTVATAQPQPGPSVPTAFTQATSELVGRDATKTAVGSTARGAVTNTLSTNPLGWFSGLGVNLSYTRPFRWDRASWGTSGRYSRTNASNGKVTSFGLGTGVDLFVFGRSNEGLRIGPRLDLSFGRETIQGSTDFARLGASGELGYNFIASNGVSASVAGGYGGRLAGDAQEEDFTSYTGGEDGPYMKLGLGYSW